MPVDLDVLPARMQLPAPARMRRGAFFILLFALLCGGLVLLFWSAPGKFASAWFCCSVVVLPALGGLMLYAVGLLVYEQRRDYAQSWNDSHAEHERQLVQRGQRAIGLVAASYVCESGRAKLADTLRGGKQVSLAPETTPETTLKAGFGRPFREDPRDRLNDARLQQLSMHLTQVLAGFEVDVQRVLNEAPLRVRIRHNAVFNPDEIAALWRSIRELSGARDQLAFATEEDGLLWLDAWLDQGLPAVAQLSLEINVPSEAGVGQSESISALLLAPAEWCAETGLQPQSWIHRPVKWVGGADDVRRALLWGKVAPQSNDFFVWHSQLPEGLAATLCVDLHQTGQSPASEGWHALDGSFGMPGAAVGNTTLIVATEQAATEARPQLILLHDQSTQACVVQPA